MRSKHWTSRTRQTKRHTRLNSTLGGRTNRVTPLSRSNAGRSENSGSRSRMMCCMPCRKCRRGGVRFRRSASSRSARRRQARDFHVRFSASSRRRRHSVTPLPSDFDGKKSAAASLSQCAARNAQAARRLGAGSAVAFDRLNRVAGDVTAENLEPAAIRVFQVGFSLAMRTTRSIRPSARETTARACEPSFFSRRASDITAGLYPV
jgi:hypothetical protein